LKQQTTVPLGSTVKRIADLEKRNADLEAKLASATTERETFRMEAANLKIALSKQLEPKDQTVAAGNDDPITTTVTRDEMKKALKEADNDLRKVKVREPYKDVR
jgi:hypothetical protein